MKKGMPKVPVSYQAAVITGGMDAVTSPIFAKPGSARLAYNYEYSVSGGVDRIRGIEPFDGQPSPSKAQYELYECDADLTGVALDDVLTGDTSGATGVVVYVSGKQVAVTKITGTFELEDVTVSSVVVGTISNLNPSVDGFLDNQISKASADVYQRDIEKVPGSGRIRGLAGLNGVIYAWRNNEAQTACDIYKSTTAGWELVPTYHQLSFTVGTSEYAEGETITQGGTSATVKRVVLDSGTWLGGNAAGRLIITTPSGGSFSGGAAAGGGACTLAGASTAITLARDGVTRTDAYTFTAQLEDKRLYCCDGVNPEYEFDGDVIVPLETGMGTIRATNVKCHKGHLFYSYRGSLQHSAIGNPYSWSAVFGAGELGTGDTITNLISVGGAQDAAALFVTCQDALYVLYGTSSADWNLVPLSHVQGAQQDSAQDIGGVVALDTPGVVRFPATRSFGNFVWDTVSMAIQPIARDQLCAASVFVPGYFKYRVFFQDGTAISGLPVGADKFAWSIINYGIKVKHAINHEINSQARTFYGDDDGWVYEADVGRSFAGLPIEAAIKLHPLSQNSPLIEKTYRQLQLELSGESAFTLYTSGEFNNAEAGPTQQITSAQYGSGLQYDLNNFDQAYWDAPATGRQSMPLEGYGTTVSLTIYGQSDNEASHTIYAATVTYTPRRITR